MKIEIKHRWTGAVLFSTDAESLKDALEKAVTSGSNLRDSDLRGSDLRGSNLSDSDLRGSDLRGSNLSDSDLSYSNLRGSDLRDSDLSYSNLRDSDLSYSNLSYSNLDLSDLSYSNLRGSNLRGSDLRGSYLRYSNLRGCDLSYSNLSYSNLTGSDLTGSNLRDSDLTGSDLSHSNLTGIRDDLWAVLSSAPKEVEGLRQALIDGHVNGSSYTGQCACLVGTIANNCNKKYNELDVLKPNSARPAERFFLAINTGDTPRNSQFSKLAVEWIDQWLTAMRSAFAGALLSRAMERAADEYLLSAAGEDAIAERATELAECGDG